VCPFCAPSIVERVSRCKGKSQVERTKSPAPLQEPQPGPTPAATVVVSRRASTLGESPPRHLVARGPLPRVTRGRSRARARARVFVV